MKAIIGIWKNRLKDLKNLFWQRKKQSDKRNYIQASTVVVILLINGTILGI